MKKKLKGKKKTNKLFIVLHGIQSDDYLQLANLPYTKQSWEELEEHVSGDPSTDFVGGGWVVDEDVIKLITALNIEDSDEPEELETLMWTILNKVCIKHLVRKGYLGYWTK